MTRPVDHNAIKWGYVLGEVFSLYLRVIGVFVVYLFTKIFVAQNRSSEYPTRPERVWRYITCVGIVAIIGIFAAHGVSDDSDVWNYNRGLIVFFTLLVAALLGVADGFRMSRRDIPPPSSSDDDW
jgi:hypothetical protein